MQFLQSGPANNPRHELAEFSNFPETEPSVLKTVNEPSIELSPLPVLLAEPVVEKTQQLAVNIEPQHKVAAEQKFLRDNTTEVMPSLSPLPGLAVSEDLQTAGSRPRQDAIAPPGLTTEPVAEQPQQLAEIHAPLFIAPVEQQLADSAALSFTEPVVEQTEQALQSADSFAPRFTAPVAERRQHLAVGASQRNELAAKAVFREDDSELGLLENSALVDDLNIANTIPDESGTTNGANENSDDIGLATFESEPGALPKLPGLGAKTDSATERGKAKLPKDLPTILSGADKFKLAAQPEAGDHFFAEDPVTDNCAIPVEASPNHFSPGPSYDYLPYDPYSQMQVYQGKTLNANRRPLVELGRPWYQLGQLSPGSSVLGQHNNVVPQFLVFGDSRTAFASNSIAGQNDTLIATQLNLDFDLKLTATERFHAFVSPNTNGAANTRWQLDNDEFISEANANINFGYFEGDLGAIAGGFTNKTLPFDLPFTIGVIPLVFQNGVWLEDAILGFAFTIPARNSARFDISNMDLTFFAGYDDIDSPAFPGDDSAARIIGMASFIEAMNGYFEIDYAFLDDRSFDDRSYHNISAAFSRRYGRFISNSTRIIVNAGQSTEFVENTADGVLLLSENNLITGHPSNVVPYFNMFAGFDRPQSAARAGVAGGVLRNTGILFESDNLTGYPTLDASGNDTFGAALGLNLLAREFSQQLVVEAAMMGVMGENDGRIANGDQYGLGARYQLPLSNSLILRADAMYRLSCETTTTFTAREWSCGRSFKYSPHS